MSAIRSVVLGLLIAGPALSAPTILIDEPWAGFSSPDILASGFTHHYTHLPLEGGAAWQGPRYWSADYWPTKKGGINLRWAAARPNGFNNPSPTRQQLLRMGYNELATLSPAEKYDVLMGRYDFPLKEQVARTTSPRARDWEGLCHGWAVATVHHSEPTPKLARNADGIQVPFGSSDIKALLTYVYAVDTSASPIVGKRCNFGRWTGGRVECDQALNAGAFHIIVANQLGLRRQAVVMDVDRWEEVWNQPVVWFKSQVLAPNLRVTPGASRAAVREMRLSTQIWYVDETENSWNPVHGTPLQKFGQKTFVYRIELDSANRIVGGTWESEERPDFIWHKNQLRDFGGYFARLPELLNDQAW